MNASYVINTVIETIVITNTIANEHLSADDPISIGIRLDEFIQIGLFIFLATVFSVVMSIIIFHLILRAGGASKSEGPSDCTL